MWSSIYKRDLMNFFYGSSAYIVFAVYVLISMILAFFWGTYFFSANQSMYSYFSYQPQIFAILIPVITMRSWAEEHKNGTIENLLTFPISGLKLISAKFCAACTISFVMLTFSLPLLITTSFYLDMDWGNIISAYIGTVISIMFLTSVGCFVSSITALPIVAYLLGLFFGLLIIGFNWGSIIISGMDNIPFYLNGVLDFSSNYQEFLTGQINIASIFYFVSATILFLFFNWLVICDRRIG